MDSEVNQKINSVEKLVGSERSDKSLMDGLEKKADKSNIANHGIKEGNPDSKLRVNPKETNQSLRDSCKNINTEHDKCSVALEGKMLGNGYQNIHDSIAPTDNNDDSNVPPTRALGDGVMTSKNNVTEGSIQVVVGKDLEPVVSDLIKEISKQKLESYGGLLSLSMESKFENTIFNEDTDHLLNTESP